MEWIEYYKAVVSEYMDVLFKTAKENEVIFLYEASVGGGIPIISSLMQILQINRIDEIKGILNGRRILSWAKWMLRDGILRIP